MKVSGTGWKASWPASATPAEEMPVSVLPLVPEKTYWTGRSSRCRARAAEVERVSWRRGKSTRVAERQAPAGVPRLVAADRRAAIALEERIVGDHDDRLRVVVDDRSGGRAVSDRRAGRLGERDRKGLVVLVERVVDGRHADLTGRGARAALTRRNRQRPLRRRVVTGGLRCSVGRLVVHGHGMRAHRGQGDDEARRLAFGGAGVGDADRGHDDGYRARGRHRATVVGHRQRRRVGPCARVHVDDVCPRGARAARGGRVSEAQRPRLDRAVRIGALRSVERRLQLARARRVLLQRRRRRIVGHERVIRWVALRAIGVRSAERVVEGDPRLEPAQRRGDAHRRPPRAGARRCRHRRAAWVRPGGRRAAGPVLEDGVRVDRGTVRVDRPCKSRAARGDAGRVARDDGRRIGRCEGLIAAARRAARRRRRVGRAQPEVVRRPRRKTGEHRRDRLRSGSRTAGAAHVVSVRGRLAPGKRVARARVRVVGIDRPVERRARVRHPRGRIGCDDGRIGRIRSGERREDDQGDGGEHAKRGVPPTTGRRPSDACVPDPQRKPLRYRPSRAGHAHFGEYRSTSRKLRRFRGRHAGWLGGGYPRSPVQWYALSPTPICVKLELVSSAQCPGLPLNMSNAVCAEAGGLRTSVTSPS